MSTPRRRESRRKTTRPPLLRCKGLAKDYGSTRALGPVDLTLGSGEAVALVGHNGSGKSTLLSLVAGFLDPSEGSVHLQGHEAGSAEARASVSYLPDSPILYDDLSLQEHLEYLCRLHGTTPEAEKSVRILDAFGLSERVDDLPADFSRGLRQKAAITVGVCRPFALLLIDEPFSGLDTRGRDALIDLLGEMKSKKRSVLVATHDQGALDIFDRVVTLEQGEIVGDTAEIILEQGDDDASED